MKDRAMRSVVLGWMPVLFLLFASCAMNPVSGGPELMLLSERDEDRLGAQTDLQVRSRYGVYEDRELLAYINDLGRKLGGISHRSGLDYRFEILDAAAVNAFAVPGGYVYLTRGILAALNNEAELAGVIGHEIGHIAARHSAQQYSRAQLAQLTLGIGMIFSETFQALAGLSQLGVQMLFLSFSRDNERQADALGVEYASKAGYDAGELAGFFETLQRMNPGSDRSGLPGWFSTHPSPEDREAAVRAMAKQWQRQLGLRDPKANREAYLRKIDGLVYGDDPRQGYVEGGVFYHPDLRFQFPVPAKWTLTNAASFVQMVSEAKDAAILLTMESGKTPREAASSFASKSGGRLLASNAVTVNGLSAQRLVSEVSGRQGTLRVLSYFIGKGDGVYVFHGFCASAIFPRYDGVFQTTMSSFKEVSDRGKISVQPDRIRIRSTKATGTLESVLRSMGVAKDDMEKTALLNAMVLEDPVKANSLLKVVERGR